MLKDLVLVRTHLKKNLFEVHQVWIWILVMKFWQWSIFHQFSCTTAGLCTFIHSMIFIRWIQWELGYKNFVNFRSLVFKCKICAISFWLTVTWSVQHVTNEMFIFPIFWQTLKFWPWDGHLKVHKILNMVREENLLKAFGHTALEFYKHQISSVVLVSSGLQCCVNQPWW